MTARSAPLSTVGPGTGVRSEAQMLCAVMVFETPLAWKCLATLTARQPIVHCTPVVIHFPAKFCPIVALLFGAFKLTSVMHVVDVSVQMTVTWALFATMDTEPLGQARMMISNMRTEEATAKIVWGFSLSKNFHTIFNYTYEFSKRAVQFAAKHANGSR